MKVLWFSISPCGSMKRDNKVRVIQGWMISLESAIKKSKDIQLEVAFFSKKKEDSFIYDGVRYYPIGNDASSNPIMRIMSRKKSKKSIDASHLESMLKIIAQSKPDIIHIHGTENSFGQIIPYINSIPICISIQGMIAPYKEKYFSGIPKEVAFRKDPISLRLKNVGIRESWASFKYRANREIEILRNTQYILGRTFWDEYCTLSINPQRRYFVVNEILRPEFYKKCWKGFVNNHTIHIVSTISGGIYKGLETALKTAEYLKRWSGLDFVWHIAGYKDTERWVSMAEAYSGYKCSDNNIRFHGRMDADSLSNLLCDSDVYVHVSHIENSPNSVCEAMLLGVPTIASFAGGTASLLANGEEGILYQDGDPYVLAGAIINLVHNPGIAKLYSEKARKRALVRHDPNRIICELIEAYNQVINNYKQK